LLRNELIQENSLTARNVASSEDRLDIERETIGHLLKDSILTVPIHQRSYAWEEEHVSDLYKDLSKALTDGDSEYFLGSIVLVKSSDGSLEVNDGQQRLATSVILLAAIRDYFFRLNNVKTSTSIEREFLVSMDRETHEEVPRLKLNVEDNEYFAKRILRLPNDVRRKTVQPSKDSHKRINAAATLAAQHIKEVTAHLREQDREPVLHKWVNYLEKSARVIEVVVSDPGTAYIIFETMNDRGMQLSAADLLKNHLFGRAGNRLSEVVQRWQSMVGALATLPDQDETIVTYVRHMWISMHGPTRTRQLYEKIKENVRDKGAAVELASQLSQNAPRYAALLTPSHEIWNGFNPTARKQVETLGLLRMSQLRPLLLAALERLPNREIPKILRACVCWSVRCLITGVPSGTLEGFYGRAAFDVREKKIKSVRELTSYMLEVVPDDAQFSGAVLNARVSQAHLARYYLRALQQRSDGEAEPEYVPNDGGEITLEHVLPQNPDTNGNNPQKEEHKALVNRLGNLVLLQASTNSTIGNSLFTAKKSTLKQSKFSLTSSVAKNSKWGRSEIEARQAELATLAVKTWPLKHL
jgi:hypothetical protein